MSLPAGVEFDRRGLVLPDTLAYDEWSLVGRRIADTTRSVVWCLGDWLVFGQNKYRDSHWGGRVPSELYARLERETGYAEQTLKNAVTVCRSLPLSRRRDNVTFSHATEIVGRVKDPEDYEGWIDFVSQGGVSVKSLRERLRKEGAANDPEANDTATVSFLEIARQFARDYNAGIEEFTPSHRQELRKILSSVVRDLA